MYRRDSESRSHHGDRPSAYRDSHCSGAYDGAERRLENYEVGQKESPGSPVKVANKKRSGNVSVNLVMLIVTAIVTIVCSAICGYVIAWNQLHVGDTNEMTPRTKKLSSEDREVRETLSKVYTIDWANDLEGLDADGTIKCMFCEREFPCRANNWKSVAFSFRSKLFKLQSEQKPDYWKEKFMRVVDLAHIRDDVAWDNGIQHSRETDLKMNLLRHEIRQLRGTVENLSQNRLLGIIQKLAPPQTSHRHPININPQGNANSMISVTGDDDLVTGEYVFVDHGATMPRAWENARLNANMWSNVMGSTTTNVMMNEVEGRNNEWKCITSGRPWFLRVSGASDGDKICTYIHYNRDFGGWQLSKGLRCLYTSDSRTARPYAGEFQPFLTESEALVLDY